MAISRDDKKTPVEWFFNDEPIKKAGRFSSQDTGKVRSLTIKDLHLEDEGVYKFVMGMAECSGSLTIKGSLPFFLTLICQFYHPRPSYITISLIIHRPVTS